MRSVRKVSATSVLRALTRHLEVARQVRRRAGWGGLGERGLAALARHYALRGGWKGQYGRAAADLAPLPEEIAHAERELARAASSPFFSLLIVRPSSPEALRTTGESLGAGRYPRWELLAVSPPVPDGSGASAFAPRGAPALAGAAGPVRLVSASGELLAGARGDWLGVVEAGDTLHPAALLMAAAAASQPSVDFVYTDEDARDSSGRPRDVFLKPGWAPEMLLSGPYVGRLALMRRSLLVAAADGLLAWEEGGEYDLLLHAAEKVRRAERIPLVLYHAAWRGDQRPRRGPGVPWPAARVPHGRAGDEAPLFARSCGGGKKALERALRRRHIAGTVEAGLLPGTFRVRPALDPCGLVDIIIPTHHHPRELRRCLTSIERGTPRPSYRITIVDHRNEDPRARALLAELPHRVIPFGEEFNFSRMMNEAARHATGDFVLFLNDDTEVSPGWLEALVEAALLPEVGVAGGLLLYPSGAVQHGGLVLGVGLVAGHSHKYFAGDRPGYLGSLAILRNYSAVDGACFLVPRRLFLRAGGFDEQLAGHFQDVDFCLRVASFGFRTVFTPFCRVIHQEEGSGRRGVRPAEIALMEARWGHLLAADPLYHPWLTRERENYDIDVARREIKRAEMSEATRMGIG